MKFPLIDDDPHDQTLVSHTHPPDWENPTPTETYNLVAIGGGTAGLVSAIGARGLGAKTALIESHLLGGDCLNYGCVPSKALIAAARAAAGAQDLETLGVSTAGVEVDFAAVMERMRRLRAKISHHDSAARFRDEGVDVYMGHARFTSPDTIEVAGKTIRFKRAVIATGAKAWVPPIPGLDDYLTNETIFTLTERPDHLVVIGSGPIGCELAQTFARLGSRVTVLEMAEGILGKEDRDAAALVQAQMEHDGVTFELGVRTERVETDGDEKIIAISRDGVSSEVRCHAILVATGRRANFDGMGLEDANVSVGNRGLEVNDFLQTSNPNIYGAGDCCSKYQFTHAADAMARIVIQNALFANTARVSDLIVPWATYTDPEVAHVGYSEEDAIEAGFEIESYRKEFTEVDRAILDGATVGFARAIVQRGTDRILGATIVGHGADDIISEFTVAMTHGIGLGGIAKTIHPYPTRAEIVRKLGDAYNRTRLSPRAAKHLETFFRWRR